MASTYVLRLLVVRGRARVGEVDGSLVVESESWTRLRKAELLEEVPELLDGLSTFGSGHDFCFARRESNRRLLRAVPVDACFVPLDNVSVVERWTARPVRVGHGTKARVSQLASEAELFVRVQISQTVERLEVEILCWLARQQNGRAWRRCMLYPGV